MKGFFQKWIEQDKESATPEHSHSFQIAWLYAKLDDRDQAFAWLNKAFEERNGFMSLLQGNYFEICVPTRDTSSLSAAWDFRSDWASSSSQPLAVASGFARTGALARA